MRTHPFSLSALFGFYEVKIQTRLVLEENVNLDIHPSIGLLIILNVDGQYRCLTGIILADPVVSTEKP